MKDERLYKIVKHSGAWHVMLASEAASVGVELRPFGSRDDCLTRAAYFANVSARKASGGKKGKRVVERIGDSFRVVKV